MSHRRPNRTPTEVGDQRLDLVKQINVMGNFSFGFAGTQNTVPPKYKNMDNHKGSLSTNTASSLLNLRPSSTACWGSSLVTDQTCLSGFTAVKPRTICSRSLKKKKEKRGKKRKERKASLLPSFWGAARGFFHQWFLTSVLICVFLGHSRFFLHKALL